MEIDSFDEDDVDRYADTLYRTVVTLDRHGLEAAAEELRPIAGEIWMGRLQSAVNPSKVEGSHGPRVRDERLRAQVFVRDGFRCTYCGQRAIPRSILVAIHDLFPASVSYDVHYSRGKIHPVFWALAPEADHILAHSRGGPNVLENLTTLHAACNTRKADSIAEEVTHSRDAQTEARWDGLVSLYPALIAAGAGDARPDYHRIWSRRYAALSSI